MKYIVLLFTLLTINLYSKDTLNFVKVYEYCVEIGIKHPDIVTAQSILETGWYKCEYCCLKSNNIFGFYYKGEYISFDSWKESIDYYKKWQNKHYKKSNSYYEFLACTRKNKKGECLSYAANPEKYNAKLKRIVNIIKDDLE